jgi:predicted PurR-regulated permease PerM
MQNNRWLQTLIVLLVIIASAWLAGQVWSFLIQFSNVFLLFFLAWLLAFVLRPIARWLTSRGMPYTMSVILIYAVLAIAMGLGGLLLVPVITQQIQQLIANFNTYVNLMSGFVSDAEQTLRNWGVKDVDLQKFYSDLASQVQGVAPGILQNTLSILQSVATLVLEMILIFLLSFYFMKDSEKISAGILQLLPPNWQDEARLLTLSIEKSFGGFIRGQVVFALVYAVLTAIVMMMPPFQLDYVLLASIVAGLCMIIPLIGNFLAFVPPMLVCLVTADKASLWPWLLLALFIMQSIMMNFLGPRIMSSAIGIHPLYVVAALLIGGQIAGFWGALFGIPVAGAINLVGRPLMRRIRHQTRLYREPATSTLPTSAFVTGPLAASLAESRHSAEEAEEKATLPHRIVDDELADLVVPRPPTLTARAWRLTLILATRARAWAGTRAQRAQARSSSRDYR